MGEVRRYHNHSLVRLIHVLHKSEICAFRTAQSMNHRAKCASMLCVQHIYKASQRAQASSPGTPSQVFSGVAGDLPLCQITPLLQYIGNAERMHG